MLKPETVKTDDGSDTLLPFFDLICFEAFSPEKQSELWKTSVFRRISDHCVSGVRLVTYGAKGAELI